MGIMSTQPKDFEPVARLSADIVQQYPSVQIVPAFGVHPWFLHELTEEEWDTCNDSTRWSLPVPTWIDSLETMLTKHPNSIVGEIGIDGFHFDSLTKDLVSPLDRQAEAFCFQLEIAVKLDRPVSIHIVKSFGVMLECLSKVKRKAKRLPPKLYFHAFGGKEGTVDQLTALCGREPGKVYFGFAPVINFRSPKTADLIRKVGLERLVLESDHEDAALVPDSIRECVRFLAEALGEDERVIIERTTKNAFDLYGLTP
jgi:TatD DNase family protein